MSGGPFRVELNQRDRFLFELAFDEESWEPIVLDEPQPLGTGKGPNAARLLAGAVGNCLAASLLLCLEKAHVPITDLRARVEGWMARNQQGRLRIDRLAVALHPTIEGEETKRYERCLDLFEDFCIVTQSVRNGIEVDVSVEPEFVGGPVEGAEGAEECGADEAERTGSLVATGA